jgi:hypothetical protein
MSLKNVIPQSEFAGQSNAHAYSRLNAIQIKQPECDENPRLYISI